MVDKNLLEAARKKLKAQKPPVAPATAEVAPKVDNELLTKAKQKLQAKKTSPKQDTASPPAAPLPRLKGDARPVEPVSGTMAVGPVAEAPVPRTSSPAPTAPAAEEPSLASKGLSALFAAGRRLTPMGQLDDLKWVADAAMGGGLTPFKRSAQSAARDLEGGKALVGAGDAKAFVDANKELDAIQYEADLQKRIKDYNDVPGFAAGIQYLYNNPDVAGAMMKEQSVNAAITTGGTAAGALAGSVIPGPGTVAGGTIGTLASSGITAAASAVMNYMQDKNIDPTNEDQVQGLFMNPEAMADMKKYAAKYGVAVGTLDAIGSLLGMKGAGAALAKPFLQGAENLGARVAGREAAKVAVGPIAEGIANLGMDAAVSGTGEAFGGLWSRGKMNANDIRDEVIFGLGAGLGHATIETVISRGEHSGRAPTAEEVANAGDNPGPPAETFVTPDEATAEGRTLFGFAPHDSADPVTVGTYNEAEAEAGKGDLRRGKIIAVKEDQAVAEDKIGPIKHDVIQSLLANPTDLTPVYAKVREAAQSLGLTPKQRLSLEVAVSDTGGRTPEAATEILNKAFSSIPLPNAKKLYSGDRTNLGVTPAVRNEIPLDAIELQYGKLYPDSGIGRPEKQVLNADKLLEALKTKNWKIVPGSVKDIIFDDPRMDKLLDKTFTFTSPVARQNFIDGGLAQRSALMQSGDVAWTGKLDGRFFNSGKTRSLDQKAIAILDENGAEVAQPEAQKFLQSFLAPGTGTIQRDGRTEFVRKRSYDPDPVMMEEFRQHVGLTKGSQKTFAVSPGFDKFRKLFDIWHKKFNVQFPTAFVELYVDENGRYVLPPELVQKMPTFADMLEKNKHGYNGMMWDFADFGRVVVLLHHSPNSFSVRPEQMYYTTLAHEMGHVVSSEHFATAPLEVRNKIFAAYRRFLLANPTTPQVYNQFKRRRFAGSRQQEMSGHGILIGNTDYYMRFEEWFAEQTARWGETNGRPLGVLGKFFRSLAKKIVTIYKDLRKANGKLEFRAELEMDQYLSSIWDGQDVLTNWPENAVKYTEAEGRQQSAKVDNDPLSQHGATANVSSVLKQVENQPFMPPAQKALFAAVRAGVDRYNWFYEWALNLRQMAARNPHIQELQLINELFDFAKNDATKIMVEAEGYLKRWRQRSRAQQEALGDLLFELDRMSYLQAGEKPRWPTQQEFAAIVQRLKMDADTLALYQDIRDFFLNSVRRQEQLQIEEAMRITDPALQQAAIKSAQDMSRALISKPYFPQLRFGKWSLTIKQSNGKLEHFELFESKRELQAALEEAAKSYPKSAGWQVEGSTVPQEVQPFMGVPPWMLDKLRSMPGLSSTQQDWLDHFRYMLAPAQSFRKRMLRRKGYSGASSDARRVFANYSFHHARFYSRIKHDFALRGAIDSLRHSRNGGAPVTEISDRKRMADFAERIYKEFRNPSQDWTALRVINAIWHLGFVPASAIVNLTQTALATAPYLSAKFGGLKGEAALMKAAGSLSTFYKQGTYKNMPGPEAKAIAKAVEEGYIDESQAAELAALAIGNGAGLRTGSSLFREKLAQGWQEFSEKSMWMFRMAEQWNRRVSFRAARQLAFDNPNTKFVQDMRTKHFLKYDQLMKAGWTDREALAYLAGVETLNETHYTYDKLARPRFMQGKKSVLFAFYMFTQNSMFMLWNNKDMMARYMLYMAIIAGPMGLVPDDAEDALNAIASKLFGKDFNLEREARKFIVDLMGEDSIVPPDLLLHGISRYSFGLGKVGDVLGAKFVPDIDMSNSMSINRVLPLNISSALKPAADWNERVANVTKDAAGAAYGVPLAIIKSLGANDMNLEDFKRWEGAMPRAFKQLSRALRLGYEGGDRNAAGAQTIPYDYEDPKEFGELLAIAAGFTPTKQSQYWDEQMAARDMDLYWSGQKQMLLRELYQSKFVYQDAEAFKAGIEKVKAYNLRAPQGYGITAKSIKSSLQRRATTQKKVESGVNPYVGAGVAAEAARLYPEANVVSTKIVK